MDRPVSIIGRALVNLWDQMFNLVLCNVLWLAAHAGVVTAMGRVLFRWEMPWFLLLVLVVPGPPATAALFYVTNKVAHGRLARVSDFWKGFKRYFLAGWKWGGLNLLVTLTLGYAVIFYGYGEIPAPYGFLLALVSLLLLGGWLLTQLFAFPFWLEQADQRIRPALQNALAFQAQNPLLTGIILVLVTTMLGLTWLFPPLLGMVTAAFLAMVGNTAVVAEIKALQQPEE